MRKLKFSTSNSKEMLLQFHLFTLLFQILGNTNITSIVLVNLLIIPYLNKRLQILYLCLPVVSPMVGLKIKNRAGHLFIIQAICSDEAFMFYCCLLKLKNRLNILQNSVLIRLILKSIGSFTYWSAKIHFDRKIFFFRVAENVQM